MKQTTFAQRLVSALVALCMVLSVCAPALAADDRVIWIQKNGGTVEPLNASNIGTKLPGCSYAYDGTTVTITMAASEKQADGMEGVTLAGGPSTDIVLVCTNNTRMDGGLGLTITGMRNVTIRTEDPSKEYTGAFYGALKVTNCYGNVTVTNPHGAAVVYSLDVDNTVGTGNVTITGSKADSTICAVAGAFGNKVNIASNGDVKIENIVSGMFGAQLRYQAVDGELTVTNSKSVTTTGGARKVDITSTGAVEIKSDDTKNVVGNGLSVNAGGAVTVKGDDAAAIKGKATITAGRNVSIQNESGIAVEGKLIVNSSTGVTVVGNTQKNAVRDEANITSSGAVNISNSRGIAVGGKLTVKNDSGTDNVTVSGTGNATLNNGADITSRGAVSITNTGSGLAVDGKLTVYNSGSVKVSGGNASAPAVSGDITLTSTGKMELSNPNGQVTNKKLTVKNSTGNVIVTGNKSDGSALVQGGASIDTTGAVTITNNSGPAIFSGLNVERSGGITVTGSRASEPIITGNSTIKNTNKVEIINNETSGRTALNITYTPPAGKGYFYQTERNGRKLHTRSAISGTTPYLCIEPDTLYTLTLPEGVTAKTNGTSDTRFYAGEAVTVTAPTDTETKKFEKWTGGGNITNAEPTNWQTSKEFTFKMPASNVTLGASYHTITKYEVKVTGGTIGGKAGMTTGSYLPGDEVTVVFDDSGDIAKQFKQWTYTGTAPEEPKGGWTAANNSTSKTFTFKMPAGNVTLTAAYKDVYTLTVADGKGTIFVNGVAGNRALAGDQITVTETGSDERHQFSSWQLSGDSATPLNPSDNWQTSKTFTFTMPAGNVTLTADYKTAYTLTVADGKGTIFVNGVAGSRALAGDQITVTETGSDEHHQFSSWQLTSSTPLVEPEEGWQSKPSFSFTMPESDVELRAHTTSLFDLTVTGGTIVDENGDTGEATGIYLPGTEVTIQFTESTDIEKQFEQWTYTGTAPAEPDSGWTTENNSTSKTFTFKMPAGDVSLSAKYRKTYQIYETIGTAKFFVNGKQVNQAPAGVRVTVKLVDGFINDHREFDQWQLGNISMELVEPDEGWQNKPSFSFTMPESDVELQAHTTSLFDLTVTGGTIEGGTSDNGISQKIVKPGQLVTVAFTESTDIEKQFEQWTFSGTEPADLPNDWQTSKTLTFTMPEGDVALTAVYQKTYHLYEDKSNAEFFVDGKQVHQAPADVRVTVKLVDDFINDHHEFDQWQSHTTLVDPEEGWEHKPSFSFTMPSDIVFLVAHRTTLYDVNVTHGTIVDETSDTGTSQKIVKPGQLVTVRAESTEENPFLRWNSTSEAPEEPDGGWPEGGWQTSKEFTFKMPNGNVTLEAQRDQLYKVSINDRLGSVTINGEARSSLWVKEGETVTVATTLKDGYWMEFEEWNSTGTAPEEPEGGWTETNKNTSTTFTFKMPNGPVELTASWKGDAAAGPDEPLDEDFGVEPAPMDTTGSAIAAVAIGGAAIWGGYEIATRVILHDLLPEGAAIPANRGQLALLVWNTAGRPEPAGAPAFADVADPDMAKAAQWCIEQGILDAKGDRFEPEGWTPKFKVIEVWNKAFPAA